MNFPEGPAVDADPSGPDTLFLWATPAMSHHRWPVEIEMAVPKKKVSPSRRGMRRSADALKAPTYVEDKDSGELRRPHHIDLKTGMYRGRQILTVKSKDD